MSESGLHAYLPLLLHLLIAVVLAGALTAASILVGWKRPNRAKQQAYECGVEPIGDAREPFSVKFYLVAMVFILFDVEAIFLYPWAYIYRDMFKVSHSFASTASWRCSSTSPSSWSDTSICGKKARSTGTTSRRI